MDKNLAWFIGPKSENSDVFEELINQIILDYFHWRKNYFPEDILLINKKNKRELEPEIDILHNNIHEFLAALRRNFPFYSPRYIAHMLSDISMPSMLGYFGAMLYNANNVTPEAAPVTTEWEIEACNEVLTMLGYKNSPKPPKEDAAISDWKNYQRLLQNEFGWAHITSGGTVANIEALWVARNIKFAPLAVKEIAIKQKLEINITLPNDTISDIKVIDEFTLINIKPNESIYLLSKYIKAFLAKFPNKTIKDANKELTTSKSNTANGIGELLAKFPLAIYVSGAAHYSIKKAADILGIGRNNIKLIEVDSHFRANITNLKRQIKKNLEQKISPLVVIGVAGTTEEGAIDPIDKIVDLRKEFEKSKNLSFWVHVDAAWGGYAKTILNISESAEIKIIESKICKELSKYHNENIDTFTKYKVYFESIIQRKIKFEIKERDEYIKNNKIDLDLKELKKIIKNTQKKIFDISTDNEQQNEKEKLVKFLKSIMPIYNNNENIEKLKNTNHHLNINLDNFKNSKINGKKVEALRYIDILLNESEYALFDNKRLDETTFQITIQDRIEDLAHFSNDKIQIEYKSFSKTKHINIGNGKNFVNSFYAFKEADSITTDPHKLGYIQYPNGIVAFKNDRIRHFIIDDAPYITSSNHNALLHTPPLHIDNINFEKLQENQFPYKTYKVRIDAFAPFILEGSKPGAAAAALWLSNKTIPLDRNGHGTIIKNSLLSTRELYEWLISWDKIMEVNKEDISHEFLPISSIYPDLNVLVFTIKAKNISSISCMNKFVQMVYNKYSIQAELGDKNHSYSQPFFLTKTPIKSPNYSYNSLIPFFDANKIRHSKSEFDKNGVLVLRATLMNPYIYPYKKEHNINFIKEFVINLNEVSKKVASEIISKHSHQQCI